VRNCRPIKFLVRVKFELKALLQNWSAALHPALLIFDDFWNKLLIDQIWILTVILHLIFPPPQVLVIYLLDNLTCVMLVIAAILWLQRMSIAQIILLWIQQRSRHDLILRELHILLLLASQLLLLFPDLEFADVWLWCGECEPFQESEIATFPAW
jgi:hypothetical protein